MMTTDEKKMNMKTKVRDVPIELSVLSLNDQVYNDQQPIIDAEQTATILTDEEAIDDQQIITEDVEINRDSSHTLNNLYSISNTVETLQQNQMDITNTNSDDMPVDSMRRNPRIVDITNKELNVTTTNITNNIEIDLDPIVAYVAEPLLPLSKACTPLINIIHNLSFYIQMAINETPDVPPDGLTIDESAAIRLYTMEWKKPHRSLYSMLNHTLNNDDREHLRPYFRYMKLFLTGLAKIPCVPPLTVWRGVTKDISASFPPDTVVTWWAFSSCTTALPVLQNNMYLGTTGSRTLFSVEAINGRTIRAHSHFTTEEEILLLPGTHMIVQSQFSPGSNLHIIHLKQVIPNEILLAPPFKGMLSV
jgi:hypothetical protein